MNTSILDTITAAFVGALENKEGKHALDYTPCLRRSDED